MPPTDEEYLATARHAMMALEAQLYRSLGGPSPSRDQSLAIAREMRDIVARAIRVLGVDGAQEIVDWYERAGQRVMRDLGTSAWEEPETVEQAKARMGTLSAAPESTHRLPDEILDELDRDAAATLKRGDGSMSADCTDVRCIVAEVRRLRSDDWLQRAAEEITDCEVRDGYVEEAAVVAILRKRRDGTR
jgi:hypothetical protein